MYAVTDFDSRVTVDVDFLLRKVPNTPEQVKAVLEEIIAVPIENDFVTFEIKSVAPIAVTKKYAGVGATVVARIKNTRTPFGIDFGIGDVIVPKQEKRKIPTQLEGFDAPVVNTYSLETTIAEKLDAILNLMEFSSRMKDDYDTDDNDKEHPGYVDMIDELVTKFPLTDERITGEQCQKEFIVLFGAILRMRNLLTSFDEFTGNEILSERDLQDYLGRYQDLRDEWRNRQPKGDKEDIIDDIVFEIELIKQIEINIDYILMLVKKYHDSHCDDKEVLITIQKAIDAGPELRSKKALIENFIAGINDVSDVMVEWRQYVAEEKERQLVQLIQEENLKEEETRSLSRLPSVMVLLRLPAPISIS